MARANPAVIIGGLVVGGVALMALAGSASAAPSTTPRAPGRSPGPSLPPQPRRYRIQEGDTLWALAERATGIGNRWRELLPLNPSTPRHPSWGLEVYAGDLIVIPDDWDLPTV